MIRLGASSMTALVGVDGAWRTTQGCRPVPVGRWTHLALTYDSATRTEAIYIDGVLDAKKQFPELTPGLLNQSKPPLLLGTNDWNPLGKEVDGKIDALRILEHCPRLRTAFHGARSGPRSQSCPPRQLGAQRRFRVGVDGLAAGRRGRCPSALGH